MANTGTRIPPAVMAEPVPAAAGTGTPPPAPPKLSEQLQRWLDGDGEKTLGSLVALFGDKSFAIVFVLLLGVPALPLPTGGATHVFEVIAALLALQLIARRHKVWLPRRWEALELAGDRQQRFLAGLLRLIRRLERHSRPRLPRLLHGRFTDIAFGLLVIGGSAAAFFAPPFSGLDTLPALGVVLLSIGVLLEDMAIVAVAALIGTVGVALEISLGAAVVHFIGRLF